MHKVISINLNGNAYQLDEDAYAALQAYLDRAQAALKDNPDKAEILADLEQAIAEKCNRFLSPHKTVVSTPEIEQIISEMGPVETGEPIGAGPGETRGPKDHTKADAGAPKRLYRIKEGAMFGGVCTGLAAYFNLDVTIVRILFVIATFITSGVAIPVYFVMMLVIPEANTSDEHAAAYGLPFNAQEIVDQAKKFAKGNEAWRRQWRRKQRQFRREWRAAMDEQSRWRADNIPAAIFAGVMTPIFGLISAGLFMLLAVAIYLLATTGNVYGWSVPPGMPFWVAILILTTLYFVVTSPLSAARHVSYRAYGHCPAFAVLSGIIWLGVVAFLIWLGSQHQAEVRDFVQNLPAIWREIWTKFQQR